MTAPEPFGQHLIVDLADCDPATICDGEALKALVIGLCEVIGMEPYGPPWAERFALHHPVAGGYTVIQPITTSLISLHASESRNSVNLDVFSCRSFDADKAVDYAVDSLAAGRVAQRQLLDRL
jgi:S-adenosylmethionine decarboxylase